MINNLFFNLIVAHILGDFYLQWGSSCKNKVLYSVKGKDLWLHSLLIGILSWGAIWDYRGWWLHIAVIVVFANVWLVANNDWQQFGWLQEIAVSHPLRAKTIVAMLLALKPANILILLILGACRVTITPTDNDDHGNFHSGELIGWLERGLMLLFVVMSQYEAIGFLIAAKSILRFNEASSGSEKSEYVLTGTLLSLATALALGILIIKI